MSELIDLTGQKIGRLKVIKRKYPNGKRGEPRWLCRCECGKGKIIFGKNLRHNHTKSCGCLRDENVGNRRRLRSGLASMRGLINSYKSGSRRRKIKYELTEKQFAEITQKDCYYCGAKPSGIAKYPEVNGAYIYNGIDRIDNNKGYVMGNVVPCCKICNRAKNISTTKEYKDWIKNSYNKIFGEGKRTALEEIYPVEIKEFPKIN